MAETADGSMTTFQIIDARTWHCGQMARVLHAEGHRSTVALGIRRAHQEMRTCFDASCVRKAWLVDGQIAVLGGVVGTMLSTTGYLWMAVSARARRYPVAFCKEAHRQLAQVMQTKQEMTATIVGDDRTAIQFALWLGFEFAPGPAEDGLLHVTFTWRLRECA